MRLRQETSFPDEDTTRLVFDVDRPVAMTLRVRVPWWATRGGTVKLNGTPLPAFASPSSYLTLTRTWKTGDRVEVTMPMCLSVCADARRSDRPGRDVRAARPGRPPRKQGADARDDLRRRTTPS